MNPDCLVPEPEPSASTSTSLDGMQPLFLGFIYWFINPFIHKHLSTYSVPNTLQP